MNAALKGSLLAALLLTAPAAGAAQQGRPDREATPPPLEAPSGAPERAEQDHFHFRRPIIRVAQDYRLLADDAVREIRSVFGDVTIEGHVEGDVLVVLGSARLAGTASVAGSLLVIGGSGVIDPGATIGRDLGVVGGTLQAPPGFSPGGDHVAVGTPALGSALRDMLPWVTRGLLWGRPIVPDLQWVRTVVAILFLVYLVLNTVLDRPVGASADVLARRPLHAFLGGLLVLLLTVPILTIVAASVIGLAVVPFLLCALVAAGLVGKTAVARAIGRGVVRGGGPEGRIRATAAFLIGFAVLVFAYMVPIVGIVTWAVTSVLGLGAASITFRSYLRRERPAPAAPPPPEAAAAAPASPSASAYVAPAPAAIAPIDFAPPVPPPPAPPPPRVEPVPSAPSFADGLAQHPRATFLDRVAAFTLDCVLIAIVNAIAGWDRYEGSFVILLIAYHVAFWAWKGTTLGGIVCNLRVVRTHGTEPRFVDALVRGLTGIFSIGALGIGCLWMLQDPQRQMWHDKIAGTLVVKVPRELVLP